VAQGSLDIRKIFSYRAVLQWPLQLPREVGESPSLEVFQHCGDVAQRDVGSGQHWWEVDGWADDLRGLFQPQRFYDSSK